MKKIYTYLLVLLLINSSNLLKAQCTVNDLNKLHSGSFSGPKFSGIYTQIPDQSIFYSADASGIDKGEYFEIQLTSGNTYNISGGSSGTYATVFTPTTGGVYVYTNYGDIATAGFNFNATATGIYKILISNNLCAAYTGITTDPIIRITCITCNAPTPINLGSCNTTVGLNSGGFVSFEGQTTVSSTTTFPFNSDPFSPFFTDKIEGTHDVYRTFVATNENMILKLQNFEVLNRSGSLKADGVFAMVYTTGCVSNQLITKKYFSPNSISGNNQEEWLIGGLSVGTTYNIVFSTDCGVDYPRNGSTSGYTGIYNWVKFNPQMYSAKPSNDFCDDALTLTPQNATTCTSPSKARLSFSSNSSNNSCNNNASLVDVWYKFVATSTKHSISTDGKDAELLTGTNCNALTPVTCLLATNATNGIHQLTNLQIGQTYYLRIYGPNSYDPLNPLATFDVCVFGNTVTCNNPVATITTRCIDATKYEAIVTITQMGSSPTINITNNLGQPVISNISTIGSYVIGPISNSTGSLQVTIVNANNTDCNLVLNATTNCQITPLQNDDYTSAYIVALGNNSCSNTTTGFTTTATKSTAVQEASCIAPYNGRDIWFTTTNNTGSTKSIVIQLGTGTAEEYRYEIYKTSTNCTNLGSSLICSSVGFDTDGGNRRLQRIDNVANGEKIYVRIWTGNSIAKQNGTVTVCAFVAPVEPYTCVNSTTLTVNTGLTTTNSIASNNIASSLEEQQCNPQNTANLYSTDAYGLYYNFTATATKHIIKYFNKQSTFGNDNGLETKVFTQTICGTGSKVNIACGETDSVLLNNLIIGEVYRIYAYNNLPENRTSYNIAVLTVPLEATNDNCNTAIQLTTTTTCSNPLQASTFGATASLQTACNGTFNDDDVWFRFTATAPQHRIQLSDIVAVVGTSTNMVIDVYEGSCTGLIEKSGCNINMDILDVNELTSGSTYYFRVYTANANSRVLFKVCVSNVPPPSNNDCSNAITATTTNFNCLQTTNGTTVAATESMPRCSGTGVAPVYDVWYKFTATNTSYNIGVSNDHYVQLFSGSCTNLTSISCGYQSINSMSLVVGQQYYIRVYQSISPDTFALCIATPPIVPSNDVCVNSTTLIQSNNNTNTWTSGTTIGALRDTGTCFNPTDVNVQDVWYKFTATTTKTVIDIQNISYPFISNNTINMQVFSGSCNNLNSVTCKEYISSGQSINTSIGITYYVRMYTTSFNNVEGANFDISIRTLYTPLNDEPINAITINHNIVPISSIGNIEGSTGTSVNCFGNTDNDVWYKFIAKSTEVNVLLTNVGGSLNYEILNSNLTSASCFGNSLVATIGNTYYIRVWDMNAGFNPALGSTAQFTISVSGGLPTTNVFSGNLGTCQSNTVLVSSGSQNWLTVTKNGSLVYSIFDSEIMGNVNSDVFIANNNSPIRTDANGVEYMDRNFTIVPQTQPTNPIKVAIYFTKTEWVKFVAANDGDNNDANAVSNLKLSKFSSNNCTNILSGNNGALLSPVAWGNIDTNYYLVFEFPSFSSAYIHGGNTVLNTSNALPVNCTQFTVVEKQKSIVLNWHTSHEINNKGFEIERSTNGINFNTIAFVTANQNGSSNNQYSYTDIAATINEVLYYRLKQIDKNNQATIICSTKKIKLGSTKNEIFIYPNPASNFIQIKSTASIVNPTTVQIISFSGKQIASYIVTNSTVQIPIQYLTNGMYIVKIISHNEQQYFKLSKQ